MKKTTIRNYTFAAIFLLVASLMGVSASMIVPANDRAAEKSPVIGANGDLVKVDFVHYAKSNNPAKPAKTETCYNLLGVKWLRTPVNYYINPINSEGLDEEWVISTISTSAETWDYATSSSLLNDPATTSASFGVQDYLNTIDFGELEPGVIGVTSVWYSRIGKQIVEFDIRFNDYYAWGDGNVDSSLMDLQNIATHELGHAVGLGDLYTQTCTAVTMYGRSNYGDIEKRTLEPADVTGLQKMYGI